MTVAQIFGMDQSVISEANLELGMGGMLEGVCLGYAEECRVEFLALFSITVHTGILTVGGVFVAVSADEIVTVSVGAALPRYDRIIARRDNATNTVWIGAKEGTPAANPTPPSLTRSGGIYEISLARILIPAGGGVIDRNIVDERGEPSLCGYISFKAYNQVQRAAVEGWRQRGSWSAMADAANVAWDGMYQVSETHASASLVQDVDGIAFYQTSAAPLDSEAHVVCGTYQHRRSYGTIFECKFKLASILEERLFVGLTNAGGWVLFADNPLGNNLGVQLSTSRLDTNFQFMTDNNVTQHLYDTGVPKDVLAHIVRIICGSTDVVFELMDTNRNIQARVRTIADLPASTLNFAFAWSGVRTLANPGAKSIYQYYAKSIHRNI